MRFSERQELIETSLARDGHVSVPSLAKACGVAPETARRDLAKLEKMGLVRRVHGGAIPPTHEGSEPDSYTANLVHETGTINSNFLAHTPIGVFDGVSYSNLLQLFGRPLPEGTPTPLIPALIIIETTSLLIRPLALGVRLTANLTAGHLLIQLISTATIALLPIIPSISALTALILFLLTILEVAVAIIQAYVFVLLLSLYLQENI